MNDFFFCNPGLFFLVLGAWSVVFVINPLTLRHPINHHYVSDAEGNDHHHLRLKPAYSLHFPLPFSVQRVSSKASIATSFLHLLFNSKDISD
jgi:hypothetical protein